MGLGWPHAASRSKYLYQPNPIKFLSWLCCLLPPHGYLPMKKKSISTFSVLPIGNMTRKLTSGDLKTCSAFSPEACSVPPVSNSLASEQSLRAAWQGLLSFQAGDQGLCVRVPKGFSRWSWGAAAHSSGKLILVLPLVVLSSASWVSFSHSANT